MRKFLIAIMFMLAGVHAHAAQMVNVEYIHKLIEQRWDITIPYSPKLSTPKVAANMKYLLTLVDMTNKRINGAPTTNYGDGEYATMAAADTIATNRAVAKLIKIKPKFFITTTPDTETFTFSISARGHFMVDWGDNTATEIVRNDTTPTEYSHDYAAAKEYTISIGGRATGYSTYIEVAAISFEANQNIAKIAGSLGTIFATIGDGNQLDHQPGFAKTFYSCTNLTGTIPPELFTEISGAPRQKMFYNLFNNCTNLTGPIPAGLFSGLRGTPADYMFRSTFSDCQNLSGSIPENLFGNISGPAAKGMFGYTFSHCYNLTGSIPENLFKNIYGTPQDEMFEGTFIYCSKLTREIPENLFGAISGPAAKKMFKYTFYRCSKLTGDSAKINGTPLYKIWPDVTTEQVDKCYMDAKGLSDYNEIPAAWK